VSEEQQAGRDKLEIDNMFLCGSRFTRVSLKDAEFRAAHLIGARLEDVDATGLAFDNANLSRASFHAVHLSGVTIENANLQGLAISRANVTDMTIDGIKVSDLIAAWDRQNADG